MTPKEIIDQLNLKPHPEGGYYRETYRSEGAFEISGFDGQRNYSTGIYYLIVQDKISAFHKIKQDEMWHFYDGDALELHIINNDGNYQKISIGKELGRGEVPQYVVKAGDYFAARVSSNGAFSLVGCTVSPGFDFRDFTMPSREELIQTFPQHQNIIHDLTHD